MVGAEVTGQIVEGLMGHGEEEVFMLRGRGILESFAQGCDLT